MSRISFLLIVPLIIATFLFSTGQLKASGLDPAKTPAVWPSGGLGGLFQTGTGTGTGTGTSPADVSINKTASSGSIAVGTNLTYTIVVTNNSPSNVAQGVTVNDDLPTGVSLKSATSTAGNCDGADPISCNLGSLAAGAKITVTVVVTANQVGSITNTATVSATNEANPANNSASVATTMGSRNYLPIIRKK
jgi:uncharacterized repeat protein (TIGR01451 family)